MRSLGLLTVLFVCNLAAQNASLNGTVKDQQGGLIPAAAITLTGTATGVAQSAVTDNDGNFEFPSVRPGTYSVKTEKKGFRTYTQSGVVLAVDERRRLEIAMEVGDTSTSVNVEAQPVAVSTESAA